MSIGASFDARIRRLRRRATSLSELASPRRTIFRMERDRRPPPLDTLAHCGAGAWIAPPARFHHPERVSLGAGASLMEHGVVCVLAEEEGGRPDATVTLGDRVRLARCNTIVCGVGISVGTAVTSSDGVAIVDTWLAAPRSTPPELPPPAGASVVIGDGVYLGFGCTVLPGVRIGEGAFIGEGAVVADDVPAHAKVYGNPAGITRRYDGNRWEGAEWP